VVSSIKEWISQSFCAGAELSSISSAIMIKIIIMQHAAQSLKIFGGKCETLALGKWGKEFL